MPPPPPTATSGNLSPIDPANSLRGKQIGYDLPAQSVDFGGLNVSAPSVAAAGRAAFEGSLPLLQSSMGIAGDQLAKHTSALGRTGSGLFNRASGNIYDQATQQGQALAAQYGFGAAGQDASNALTAGMANQNAGIQGRLFNANSATQSGLDRIALQERQQNRQDTQGQNAFNNQLAQLGLLGVGFNGNPSTTDLGAAGAMTDIANQYGSTADQTNQTLAQTGENVAGVSPVSQLVQQLINGGGGTKKPTSVPATDYLDPYAMG